MSDDLQHVNLANWEARVPVHAASETYDLASYLDDPGKLSGVVAYDEPHLGDLTGQRIVHLQCHIGTDTLSLARLGGEVCRGWCRPPSAATASRSTANGSR